MRTFDVAIAGAGPAGAACALRASQSGLSVVLFDPQGRVFDKPCGEGILPSGVRALHALGLHELEDSARPFDRVTYLLPRSQPLELSLSQRGWAIWRTDLLDAFDRALVQHDVTRVAERVTRIECASDIRIESASAVWHARCLVVACGSNGGSPWIEASGSNVVTRARRPRLGVRARCAAAEPLDRVVVGLGGAFEVYLTPLPHDAVNVALLLERMPPNVRGADALLDWALAREPDVRGWIGARLGPAHARDSRSLRPHASRDPRVMFVGDAAGSVDPVIGCGVALALTSGLRAADGALAIARGASARTIAVSHHASWLRDVRTKRAVAAALRWVARHPRIARPVLHALRAYPGLAAQVVRSVERSPSEAATPSRLEKPSVTEPAALA